jgi:antitoxin component of MazEF toxin-antitoxin module
METSKQQRNMVGEKESIVKVWQRGGSTVITIPKKLGKGFGIEASVYVGIRSEGNELRVRKLN